MSILVTYVDGSTMIYDLVLGFELESDTKHLILQLESPPHFQTLNFPRILSITNLTVVKA